MPEPQTLLLDEAVQIIKRSTEQSAKKFPYFFVAGAGVSYPPIPLAGGIVKHCLEQCPDIREPDGLSPMEQYSFWLEKVYPSREGRANYFRSLIEDGCISPANFRLAHLLLSRKLADTVVTMNFDDYLTKALLAFGEYPVVCDHPATARRIEPDRNDVLQILHVHGTYRHYELSNLAGEVERSAERLESTTDTMVDCLQSLLNGRSPLVVGYSGWERDVFMSAFRRERNRKFGVPIFWFCYSRQGFEDIHPDVKFHPDVRFVLPPSKPAPSEPPGAPSTEKGHSYSATPSGMEPGPAETEEPALPATHVFDALIQAFGVPEPPLTRDPLGFWAKQIGRLLPTEDDRVEDVYSLRRVARRLERAADEWAVSTDAAERSFEEVLRAVRTSEYGHAIATARQMSLADLDDEQIRQLADRLTYAAQQISEGHEMALQAYEFVTEALDRLGERTVDESVSLAVSIKRCGVALFNLGRQDEAVESFEKLAERFVEDDEAALREQAAWGLVDKGVTLGTLGRHEEEIAVYDEVVNRFGEADEAALRELAAGALLNKGLRLGTLGRDEEEIAVYDEVVKRFAEDGEAALREQAAKALVNKGVRLGRLGRDEEAIAVYDEVVKRFAEAGEAALREQVAKALVNKGFTLGRLGRDEEEIAVYDEVVKRFGEAREAALREQVAKALVNKGLTLGTLGRDEEAIAVYDEVVKRFGEAGEAALREQVANALFNKAATLGRLGRSEEEIAVYDEVVKRFGEADEAALREQVAGALFNKGVTLGTLGRSEEEIAVYDEVVKRFGEAGEAALRAQVADALFNKGITLGTLGRSEEKIAVYDEVVKRFGEAGEAALRAQVADALFNKGITLGRLGRSEEEIAVYDEVVKRFGEADEAALREQVAGALFNKGVTLGTLGRSEEEIAVYDEVVKRFGEAGEAALRAQVADALFNKGITLGTLGRSEEKIAVYDEVVKRFGEAGEAALRAQVADALFNKGITLGRLGRDEEAIAVYDEVAERFGKADEAALRAQAAKALNSMAFTRLTEAKLLLTLMERRSLRRKGSGTPARCR